MCTRPSSLWITAGYEYSPASLSSASAASQLLPSRETATFSGDRSWVVWLYTIRWRPSRSVSASMPELGFGSGVSAIGVHVRPPSVDHVSKMCCDRVRPTAWSVPRGCTRMLGWIASMVRSGDAGGDTDVHVSPPSVERSKCTRHLLERSADSVLLPATS